MTQQFDIDTLKSMIAEMENEKVPLTKKNTKKKLLLNLKNLLK